MLYAYLQQQAEQKILNYINDYTNHSHNVAIIRDSYNGENKMIVFRAKNIHDIIPQHQRPNCYNKLISLGQMFDYFKTNAFLFEILKIQIFKPIMELYNVNINNDFFIAITKAEPQSVQYMIINDTTLSQPVILSSSLTFLLDPINYINDLTRDNDGNILSYYQNSYLTNIPKIIEKKIDDIIHNYFLLKTYFQNNNLPFDIFNIISTNMI